MNERTVQSIPVMPFALMFACIAAVIGLIIGIFYAAVFGAIFAAIPSTTAINLGALSILFGVGAIVIMPIICFIGGLIEALIVAALYNFLAPRIGGVKVRLKEDSQTSP